VVGKNLVTQLSNLVVNTGDVYISLVPFEMTQPSQIASTFSQIGTEIAKLRVAR